MDSSFDTLKKEWKELMIKGRKEEADKLYWGKIFPFIERKFARETQELIKNGEIPQYDLLVIPMGLESSYYILLINGLKPKKVYFLCTKEGEKYFLDKIIKMTGLTQGQYEKDVIEYKAMDAADVYSKIKNKLYLFKGKKIAVDLTRGKRIMTAGAAIVGDFFGCDLIHIDEGWYDDIKRGEPGTEKLIKLKNPLHIFGDLEQTYAIELFNNHRYFSSSLLFRDIIKKAPDPREFEVKSLLSESYMFWDSFNYRASLPILERAVNKINQYNVRALDIQQLKMNLTAQRYLNKIQFSDKKLIDTLKNEYMSTHLIADIFCNAQRRAEQNKFEDAVSRFYRAIELVSQHRLAKIGIDSSSPDYSLLDIKTRNKYDELTKEIYKEEKALPLQTALKSGHIILFAIEDDIWKEKTIQDLKNFIDCIKLRDYSFIAHGVQIISKNNYEKLKEINRELLKNLCLIYEKDFNSLINCHRFLKLR